VKVSGKGKKQIEFLGRNCKLPLHFWRQNRSAKTKPGATFKFTNINKNYEQNYL